MKKALVSIVIVNYNGKELLDNTLKSVYKSSFSDYQVLVVDNASDDNSLEFVKKNYSKVKLVKNESNEGYVGINSALKFCNGKYILFLNNDIQLEKNCLSELLKALKSMKNAAMAAPKLVNFYDKRLSSGGTWVSRAFYSGHIKGTGDETIKEIPYMGIGLIDRVVIDMFGYLFDKDYFIYAEDLDLGLRLRLLGLKTIFAPNAVAYHLHAATIKKTKSYKRTFLMERNLLTTFFKILSFKNILIYLPYVIMLRIIAILRDFAAFKFMNGFARINAMIWVLIHFDIIKEKRKGLQLARRADDDFLFKVFSEKYLFKQKFIV